MFLCGASPLVVPATDDSVSPTQIECTFDDDQYVTKIEYPDNTFEEYTYNAFKQVTRYRDRKGNVTLQVFDANGNLLTRKVGIKVVNSVDTNQPEYAEYKFAYVDDAGAKFGNLETAFSPLHNDETDIYRTDYTYHINGQLNKVIQSADVASGNRAETAYTYNTLGLVGLVSDPLVHQTIYSYDGLGRNIEVEYDDGTTDQSIYGAAQSGDEARVVQTKNRMNVITSYDYDAFGRVSETVVGSHTADQYGQQTAVTDPTQKRVTTRTYVGATSLPLATIADGKQTVYHYDYRRRLIKTQRWPNEGTLLENITVYVNNRVFYTEDPYGRREYMGYSVSNGTELIRRVQANHPDYTLADNAAVINLTRSSAANAAFAIVDAIKDANGNVLEVVDARNVSSNYEYDSRDRQTMQIAAEATAVEAQTETIYNAASQVVEIRSPRYFDAGDWQDQYMKTLFTYTGRGLKKSQRVAPNASLNADATTSYTYNLEGKLDTTTDAMTNVWTNHYDNGCCDHYLGTEDPQGHGTITYSDPMKRAYHGATVSDYDTHTGSDPTDAKTFSEWTTRYDNLGRVVARTQWLEKQGSVSPTAVPIAGLDSVGKEDGITALTFYDANLADGAGFDHASGITLPKLGGGTYSLSLANVLTQLAATEANGGANTTFQDDVSAGRLEDCRL